MTWSVHPSVGCLVSRSVIISRKLHRHAPIGALIGSVTSLQALMFVCQLVGRLVGRSVIVSYLLKCNVYLLSLALGP